MQIVIFNNEKKAKAYEIRAAVAFHIYSEGELIRRVKTDQIDKLNEHYAEGQITVTEMK